MCGILNAGSFTSIITEAEMALLTKSEYGSVNIGKQVLSKLILDEILKYSDIIYPCVILRYWLSISQQKLKRA